MAHPEFLQEGFDKQRSHVIEECGEVVMIAGKIQRFGIHSVNPLLPVEEQVPNIDRLRSEMLDLQQAIDRLYETALDL